MRTIKFLTSSLIIIAPAIIFLSSCSNNNYSSLKNCHCYDGDTLVNGDKSYRLIGIDTPEMSHSWENFKTTSGIEHYYAQKAKVFCNEFIKENNVVMELFGKDYYDRDLVKISMNKEDYGLKLIELGLARVAYISSNPKNYYFFYEKDYVTQLFEAESIAKKNKVGLWSVKNINEVFPKISK